jgi:hypothetical protein
MLLNGLMLTAVIVMLQLQKLDERFAFGLGSKVIGTGASLAGSV